LGLSLAAIARQNLLATVRLILLEMTVLILLAATTPAGVIPANFVMCANWFGFCLGNSPGARGLYTSQLHLAANRLRLTSIDLCCEQLIGSL
jgi:hypothetical protein